MPDITLKKAKSFGQNSGFTLIELLVVISIVGLLASIVMSSLSSARDKAKYSRAQTELRQIMNAIFIAQGEQSKPLVQITQHGCIDCICRDRDIRNIPTSDQCYINWLNALNAIQNATANTYSGLERFTRDPWGSPYGLDENERESPSNPCIQDTIRSAGPDGILYNTDDQGYLVPFSRSCP